MEILKGKEIQRILTNLAAIKQQVSMRIAGTDYSRITIILGLAQKENTLNVIFDMVEGLAAYDDPRLIFEFFDERRIPFRFEARLCQIGEKEFSTHFPSQLIRLQRREHFRLELPSGCKLQAKAKDLNFTFAVKDISLGGASVILPKRSFLDPKQELKEIRLSLFLEENETEVCAESATIRSVYEDRHTGAMSCGLKFENMKTRERQILQDFLRQLERYQIRKLRGEGV